MPARIILLAATLALLQSPGVLASESPLQMVVGKLQTVNAEPSGTSESFECLSENNHRVILATVNRESQWVEVVIEDQKADFRGIATRARFQKGAEQVVGYYLESEGPPGFYDFSLTFNRTSGEVQLRLKSNAFEFNCTSARH